MLEFKLFKNMYEWKLLKETSKFEEFQKINRRK